MSQRTHDHVAEWAALVDAEVPETVDERDPVPRTQQTDQAN